MRIETAEIVIVGAGLAALRTAEALRSGGFTGNIVVLGNEAHMPYNRPPLSKKLLTRIPDHQEVGFRPKPIVSDVQWRLGESVEHADLDARTLRTSAGELIRFDALVIATGVRPRRLPIPGPTQGRYVLRSLEDAELLHRQLRPGARVLVIGAGFIGCELAATATDMGCTVSLVAADIEPMVRPLGEEVGAAIKRRHESRGTRFFLGRGLRRFLGDGQVTGVELDDGTQLEADVVIEAIGSVCNTEWLEENGLDLRDGVLTDENLQVGHPALAVAVGDVARFPNLLFDDVPRRIEHWQLASDTAKTAAATILAGLAGRAAGSTHFRPLPYFWSDQHTLRLQSFGAPNLADRIEVLEGSLDSECAIGYFAAERLVAVVLFDLNRRAAHYRDLVGQAGAMPAIAAR